MKKNMKKTALTKLCIVLIVVKVVLKLVQKGTWI